MDFSLFVALMCAMLRLSFSDIYPTIFWDRRNPMFRGNFCNGEGFANIYVDLAAKITFACPKDGFTSTYISEVLQRGEMFENLYMVTEEEFRTCNVTKLRISADDMLSEKTRLVMLCDDPRSDAISYHEFYLRSTATGPRSFVFKPHETYYFISTSTGSRSSIRNLERGHCGSHNMRVAIHICPQNTGCHKCKNLCCPSTHGPTPPSLTSSPSTISWRTPSENPDTDNVAAATSVESTYGTPSTHSEATVARPATRERTPAVYRKVGNDGVVPVAASRQSDQKSGSYVTTSALSLLFVGIGVGVGLTVLVGAAIRYCRRRRSKSGAQRLPQRDSMSLDADHCVSASTTLTRQDSLYRHGITDLKRLLSTAGSTSSGDRSSNASDCI